MGLLPLACSAPLSTSRGVAAGLCEPSVPAPHCLVRGHCSQFSLDPRPFHQETLPWHRAKRHRNRTAGIV